MKFNTSAESYKFYSSVPASVCEARAQAIETEIRSNTDADLASLTHELEGLQAALEEGKVEPVEQRSVIMTGAKAEGGTEPAEYRSAFVHHLQGKTLTGDERNAFTNVNVETRAFNALDDSQAIVPDSMLNEIIVKARTEGGIIGSVRMFNMPSNIVVPVATPGAAASWHVEGAEVESERANVADVRFEANEILRVISISQATKTMSVGAFEGYLTDELSSSVMETIGRAIVSGTGEGQGTGILTGVTWDATNTVTTSDLKFTDLLELVSTLKRGYSKGAKFAVSNKTLWSSVYGLADDNNRPVYLADAKEGGNGRLLGFEVIVDDYLPDDTILFANFNFYGVNLPSGIAVDMSRESSFKRGLVDYRAMAVADCKPIVSEAFVKLTIGE